MKSALCVGINKYGSGADLAGCVNDANDWTLALTQRGYAVQTILDGDATRKNLIEAIKGLIAKAVPGDSLAFQYSGHGSYVPDDNGDEADGADECICPVDIFSNGEITDDELYTMYSNRGLGIKLVIISDSCHSGTVSRFMTIPRALTNAPDLLFKRQVRFLPPAAFLPAKKADKLNAGFRRSLPAGRHAGLLISGCLDPEYSYDAFIDGRPCGAFSYAALTTLAKLPADASYTRWYSTIRKILPSSEYPQTPNLYGSSTMRRWHVFE